jgi:hypothetical protein
MLARSLHIPKPDAFIGVMPQELLNDMLKKELEYKGLKPENKIKKTVFRVVPKNGTFVVEVEEQELY